MAPATYLTYLVSHGFKVLLLPARVDKLRDKETLLISLFLWGNVGNSSLCSEKALDVTRLK